MSFFATHSHELIQKLGEHLFMVAIAITAAIAVVLPLAMFVRHHLKLKQSLLAVSSILQTIPSLAMLALMLPLLGIGKAPAIVALVLYALLPILQNTITGFEQLPADVIEAAKGLGLTPWQRLRIVEIPLALPTIIAGIRTATVWCVSIATLAAFIGGGGLGDFINRGLAMNDWRLLMLGAVPTALLALTLDQTIAALQHTFGQRTRSSRFVKAVAVVIFVGVVVFPVGHYCQKYLGPAPIRIATKNSAEQMLLGEMLSQLVENKTDLQVERNFNFGSTEMAHRAITHGDIDVYPEYTGTAYMSILHKKSIQSAAQTYKITSRLYKKNFQLTWSLPFGFKNQSAIAVSPRFYRQYHLHKLSSLSERTVPLSIAAPPEFVVREDSAKALRSVYGLYFAVIKSFEPGLMYQAAGKGEVDAVMAASTDPRLNQYHLRTLEDDKQAFPPYEAAAVIRQAVIKSHPRLLSAINQLAGKIDDKTMRHLNRQVVLEKRPIKVVATAFLKSKHLI